MRYMGHAASQHVSRNALIETFEAPAIDEADRPMFCEPHGNPCQSFDFPLACAENQAFKGQELTLDHCTQAESRR